MPSGVDVSLVGGRRVFAVAWLSFRSFGGCAGARLLVCGRPRRGLSVDGRCRGAYVACTLRSRARIVMGDGWAWAYSWGELRHERSSPEYNGTTKRPPRLKRDTLVGNG